MNIENAEVLTNLVGKRVLNKEDGLTYTCVSFEKMIKAMNNPKIIYRLTLKNKIILGSTIIEIKGNEDKLITKMRNFEISKGE